MLEKNNITPDTLGLLFFIKLNSTQDQYVIDIIKTYCFDMKFGENELTMAQALEHADLIKYIKTGKKDPWFRIRLSDKGEEIIKSLSSKPQHSLAEECWNILKEAYEKYDIDSKKIHNASKTTHYISEFLYQKEEEDKTYTALMFKALIHAYLDSYEYERKIYVPKTVNLLFKSDNIYATKFNKDSSPLYQYSNTNINDIRKKYGSLYKKI